MTLSMILTECLYISLSVLSHYSMYRVTGVAYFNLSKYSIGNCIHIMYVVYFNT